MVNGIDGRSHNFRASDAAFGGDSAVPGSAVVGEYNQELRAT